MMNLGYISKCLRFHRIFSEHFMPTFSPLNFCSRKRQPVFMRVLVEDSIHGEKNREKRLKCTKTATNHKPMCARVCVCAFIGKIIHLCGSLITCRHLLTQEIWADKFHYTPRTANATVLLICDLLLLQAN